MPRATAAWPSNTSKPPGRWPAPWEPTGALRPPRSRPGSIVLDLAKSMLDGVAPPDLPGWRPSSWAITSGAPAIPSSRTRRSPRKSGAPAGRGPALAGLAGRLSGPAPNARALARRRTRWPSPFGGPAARIPGRSGLLAAGKRLGRPRSRALAPGRGGGRRRRRAGRDGGSARAQHPCGLGGDEGRALGREAGPARPSEGPTRFRPGRVPARPRRGPRRGPFGHRAVRAGGHARRAGGGNGADRRRAGRPGFP